MNARLIDPETGYDGPGAIHIRGDKIAEVACGPDALPEDLKKRQLRVKPTAAKPDATKRSPFGHRRGNVTDCGGLPVAPGMIDMRVFVGEPGARHRESFRSAGQAAAAGGVTTIVAQPDTTPPMDDPAVISFAQTRARQVSDVNVVTMGALTKGLAGAEMTEQQFLLDAGAVAVTDGDHALADTKLMRAIMTYATATGALIVHHPQDPSLSKGTCATSGEFASRLALPSVPAIAERIMLERDLALVESTGARYHADQITTEDALEPLARAKGVGLPRNGRHLDPPLDAERIRHR